MLTDAVTTVVTVVIHKNDAWEIIQADVQQLVKFSESLGGKTGRYALTGVAVFEFNNAFDAGRFFQYATTLGWEAGK